MATKKQPQDFPAEVAGIDWRELQKGDVIPAHKIAEAHDILFPNRKTENESFRALAVKGWLEQARASIGSLLVFKQENDDLAVLTDEQAIGYLNSQATAGLRKHKSNTRKMFTAIDVDNLQQSQKDELATNQARHALVLSAAEGARRQAVKLLRGGAKLPAILPPDA